MPDAIVARVPASPDAAGVAPGSPVVAADAAAPPVTAEMRAKLLGAYKRMLSYQFYGAIALVVLLGCGILTTFAIAYWQLPLLFIATLTGMLGAFFSALTRLYNVDELSIALISPTVSELEGRYLLMYSLVPPIIGAIASVVIYVAFVAGIIEGGVFPKMACMTGHKCETLQEILDFYGPATSQDYGKAWIWAFIAGFSERLVPDLLQSLVSKTQKADSIKS